MADERGVSRSPSSYEREAQKIVGSIMQQSLAQVNANNNTNNDHSVQQSQFPNPSENGIPNDESDGQSELAVKTRNIEWGAIGDFTIEYGEKKINEYIKTCWDYQKCWLFCIDYLSVQEHEFDIRHVYRVRWSAPTRRKPIPRATACVYFTISLHKYKPAFSPLDVFFVIESNRFVHRPGEARFRESWLSDVIESKVQLMAAIDF